MKKERVFLYEVLACNRRKLDSQKLYRYFKKNGYTIVNNPQKADLIILSTCAYSNRRTEYALNLINKFKQYDAELLVTGCLPLIDEERLRKIFQGKTVGTKQLEEIDALFPENDVKFKDLDDANHLWENLYESFYRQALKDLFTKSKILNHLEKNIKNHIFNNLFKESSNYGYNYVTKFPYYEYIKKRWEPRLKFHRDTYFIRPSWGCLGNCSYCAIKKAIGRLESKPLEEITSEFKKGLNLGYKKFLFDADDLGAYGIDIGKNFPEMLDEITNIPGDYQIHVRYIHPQWIIKYIDSFEKILKKGKIKSVGCSLQSGNERILKLMNRYSKLDKIREVFPRLTESYPDLSVSTECINGFPSETFEEFKDTLDLITDLKFHWGYIYPFSCKKGTSVEKIEPKISDDEIINRMKYARRYFQNRDYNSSFFKNSDILVFRMKNSPIFF